LAGTTSTEATVVRATLDRGKTSPGANRSTLEISSTGGQLTIPVFAEEPAGRVLFFAPEGVLTEAAFPEEALYVMKISGEPTLWRYRAGVALTLRNLFFQMTLSGQATSEATLTVSLERDGRETTSRQAAFTVSSLYPTPIRKELDMGETPVLAGDELVVGVSSAEDAWIYLGGDSAENSFLTIP
ncbi:MAG: hypothetical protein AB1640_24545, partial [bacterium]